MATRDLLKKVSTSSWTQIRLASHIPRQVVQMHISHTSAVIAAQAGLGFELLAHYYDKNSLVLSPFSIAMCLGLSMGAAEPELAARMAKRIGPPAAFPRLAQYLGAGRSLCGGYLIAVCGNPAKTSSEYSILEKSFQSWAHTLGAEIKVARELETIAGPINDWVSKTTDGMIDKMVDEVGLEGQNVIFINAISFKQGWVTTFADCRTKLETFRGEQGDRMVSMMHCESTRTIRVGHGYTAVELDFGEDEATAACTPPRPPVRSAPLPFAIGTVPVVPPADTSTFVAYLPNPDVSIPTLLATLAGPNSSTKHRPVVALSFPRLDRPIKFDAEVQNALDVLGVPYAPLTRLTVDHVGRPSPRILHKASIEWDEEGAKAAAATLSDDQYGFGLYEYTPPRPINIVFDRPFVFSIEKDGMSVFVGVFA